MSDPQALHQVETALYSVASMADAVMSLADRLTLDPAATEQTEALAAAIHVLSARMGWLAEVAATAAGCKPLGFRGVAAEGWLMPEPRRVGGDAS